MPVEDRGYEAIKVAVADHIATITLNRPEKKNALSAQMVNELMYALDDCNDELDVRVVVLTGAGGTFCAGGDLKGMAASGGKLAKKGDFDDLLLQMDRMSKPLLARIEGYAMGGALGAVACCHFAIAAESAVLGTPEIKRGLFPMMIMAVLRRVVPQRKLLHMMLLGERMSAAEALDLGLVTEVAPDGGLDTAVAAVTEKLAARSPTAMRMGLNAFRKQSSMPLEEALPFLREQLHAMFSTEDAREGIAAFMQKRDPVWTGR